MKFIIASILFVFQLNFAFCQNHVEFKVQPATTSDQGDINYLINNRPAYTPQPTPSPRYTPPPTYTPRQTDYPNNENKADDNSYRLNKTLSIINTSNGTKYIELYYRNAGTWEYLFTERILANDTSIFQIGDRETNFDYGYKKMDVIEHFLKPILVVE